MGFSAGPQPFYRTDPDLYTKLVNQYGADTANLLSTGLYGSFDRDYGARTQAMQLALDDPKQFSQKFGQNLGFAAGAGMYNGTSPNGATLAAKFMASSGIPVEEVKTSLDQGGSQYSSMINDNGDWTSGISNALSDFVNSDIGKVALVAAAYYGGPAAVDALTSGAATSVPEAIQIGTSALPAGITEAQLAAEEAAANASMQGITASQVGTAAAAPALTAELPAGYTPYQAPEVTKIADLAAAPATTATDAGAAATGTAAGAGTSLADIGSGTLATPGDVGTQFVTQGGLNPAATVGQITDASLAGASLSPAAIAGTGAATAGLLGAATTASGDLVPATLGLDAGTAAAGTAAGAGLETAAGNATTLADILPYTTGANVVSSIIGANAASSAADAQSAAAKAAIDQQQANFNTINQQQAPYRAAGYTALNDIAGMTSGQTPQYDASGNVVKDAAGNPVMNTGSGYLQHQFDATDLKNGLAPNYDFMLQQGQMANQRAANVGGGGLSGNTLQGLQKYTQDYAGNAYQNAFTNYQNQRSNIYNTLASIAGIGQTGQTATNTAATNATNATTQLGVGSAAAQAAGQTGTANAYANALGNVTNNYTLAALLNQGGKVV